MLKLRHFIPLSFLFLSPLSYADYPSLSSTTIDSNGTRLVDTNNVVKLAIEQNRFIPLRYNQKFKDHRADLFKEVEQLGEYELNAYVNSSLVRGIQNIVGEFACVSYRHYSEKPQASSCNDTSSISPSNSKENNVSSHSKLEGKPFIYGQYVNNRLTTTLNNISIPARSYDLFLPSAQEKPLNTIWGAVHQLDSSRIFNNDTKPTVLTVYIDAYKMNQDGERTDNVIEGAQVILVVVPRVSEIALREDEKSARDFAINHAKVIVPVYSQ
ncbi:hypothetical protein L4D20_02585 [Vibrio kyushuensis]|uniref:hypothetical protein n=1 Tax=Vibrio kyushuensis TaxID=2910249 RepID=UPI003D0E38E3